MNSWLSKVFFTSSPAMLKILQKQPRNYIHDSLSIEPTHKASLGLTPPKKNHPSQRKRDQRNIQPACEIYCRRLKPPSGTQLFILHTNTPVAYLTNSAIWFLAIQFCPGFKRDKEWTQINDSRSDSWKGRQKRQQQNRLGPLSLGAHSSSYFKEP